MLTSVRDWFWFTAAWPLPPWVTFQLECFGGRRRRFPLGMSYSEQRTLRRPGSPCGVALGGATIRTVDRILHGLAGQTPEGGPLPPLFPPLVEFP